MLLRSSAVVRCVDAPPQVVEAVMADGWRYGTWMLGVARVVHVDPSWPAPGSRLQHRVAAGSGPHQGELEVLAHEDGGLVLRRRTRTRGRGQRREQVLRLGVEPVAGGRSLLRLGGGSLTGAPTVLRRRAETLRRLAQVATARAVGP